MAKIGGAATAPLTQDVTFSGKGHHVAHGQKIGLIVQLADQRQFMRQHITHLLRRACRIAPAQAFIGQAAQPIGGGFALGDL